MNLFVDLLHIKNYNTFYKHHKKPVGIPKTKLVLKKTKLLLISFKILNSDRVIKSRNLIFIYSS